MFNRTLHNIIKFTLNFTANFFLLTTFYGIIEIINPIQWNTLKTFMAYFNIPYTEPNVTVTLSTVLLLIPCILTIIPQTQKYYIKLLLDIRECTPEEKEYLESITKEICEKSGNDPNEITLRIADIDDYNAFTAGYNTIAFTKKCIQELSREDNLGFMAHEMGHYKHGDAKETLVNYAIISVGNAVIFIYNLLILLLDFIGNIPLLGFPFRLAASLVEWFVYANGYILQMPNLVVTRYGDREIEFSADRYACEIGYGENLYNALQKIDTKAEPTDTTFRYNEHPRTKLRLQRIRQYLNEHQQPHYHIK